MTINIRYIWLFIIAAEMTLLTAIAQEGDSPFNPAPVGARLSGIIECGQGYTSHELYNMNITLLEVVRGDDAWKRLRMAGDSNKPAAAGFEYVLARVKFEYYARGTPGLCVHKLLPEQFTACSVEGVDYPAATDVVLGWIGFLVRRTDKKPLLNYSADAGGAVLHGGSKWFKLY